MAGPFRGGSRSCSSWPRPNIRVISRHQRNLRSTFNGHMEGLVTYTSGCVTTPRASWRVAKTVTQAVI
jgi:hypothetical protein